MSFFSKSFEIGKGEYGNRIVLKGKWDDKIAKYARKDSICEFEVNSETAGTIKDLSFLVYFPELVNFVIIDLNIKDISPIHSLHRLKSLEISTYCNTPIDFFQFPELENCIFYWRPKSDSLFECKTIRKLFILHYPYHDGAKLAKLENLEDLSIVSSPITDIRALGSLKKLKNLSLHILPKLSSLDGFVSCTNLQRLEIGTCKKIFSIKELKNLINLENLTLDNCGDIDSLEPLEQLTKLKSLSFIESTNIVDGDLTPLLELPKLQKIALQNRRHYSHTREGLERLLRTRQ